MSSIVPTPSFSRDKRAFPFVIGIDLGTTNSLMAIARPPERADLLTLVEGKQSGGKPTLFVPVQVMQLPQVNLDGTVAEHTQFPSVVYQPDAEGPRWVGMGAKEARFQRRRGRQVFYSAKLELGTDRDPYYPSAITPDLNTPLKVSAAVLKAMKEAAEAKLGCSLSDVPVIITIPASFQSSQRKDTLIAAKLAGFQVGASSLFDEPNAALLGYMNRQRVQQRWNAEETVLVFDFGGGTCDISIVDVSLAPLSKTIHLRSLAISRFEQLGGDDIDKHIVHTFLKEKFYTASGKKEREWGFGERQHSIWSQLAKIAELLKVRFCTELDRVAQGTNYSDIAMRQVQVSLPPQEIQTTEGPVLLDDLSLDWTRFRQVMDPFLDWDCAQNEDREYYRLTSIFTPIKDAMEKANLRQKDITRILLVGGSSYNPLVEQELQAFFFEASVDRPQNMDFLVAEGAAVHAFWKFVVGHDLLAPILGDTIGLLTEGGQFVPLVQASSPIPFPNEKDWKTYTQFRVPRDRMNQVDLVICAGSNARPVHTVTLRFGESVPRNSAVHLKIRFDSNKIFKLDAYLPNFPHIRVQESVDNPLGLLPMTSLQRQRAELEKTLAAAQATQTLDQHIDQMERIAGILNELDRSEQALEWIRLAIRLRGGATRKLRQMQAHTHFALGETEEAHRLWSELSDSNPYNGIDAFNAGISATDLEVKEKYMRRSVAASPNSGISLFGLGKVLLDKGEYSEGKKILEQARSILEAELTHWPNSRQVLSFLAAIYSLLGQETRAAELWRRYHELGSDSIDINTDNLVAFTNALLK